MSDLFLYPTAISVALIVAGFISYLTEVPYLTATTLLLTGGALAGLVAYRPPAPVQPPRSKTQARIQQAIARLFRLVIGASVISFIAVAALHWLAESQGTG